MDLDLKNFSARNGNVRFANDNLCFDEVKGDSKSDKAVNVSTNVMSIDSGAYEVSIQYDSYVAENRMDISNARVSLTSIVNIKCENITLSDAHTYESGKLWVPMFSKCNDLRLNIAYNGSGKLKIHCIILHKHKY